MIAVNPDATTTISWIAAAMSMCPRVLPSDVDALSKLLSNLGSSRSSFEGRFEIATAFVVLGVIAEVVVVPLEFVRDRLEYRRDLTFRLYGITEPLRRPLFRFVLAGLLAAIFVADGVAGEFWYELRIGEVDDCIQKVDNARATLLEKAAGDASQSAIVANTAAGNAQAKADAVGVKARKLAGQVDAASAELGKTEAAEKRLQTEQNETAHVLGDANDTAEVMFRFEAEGMGGRLPRTDLTAALKNVPPGNAVIEFTSRPEPRMFATIIWLDLRKAGWNVQLRPTGPLEEGVTIVNRSVDLRPTTTLDMLPDGTTVPTLAPVWEPEMAANGVSNDDDGRFKALALALGAIFKKDPRTKPNWVRIMVGPSETTK